MRLEKKNKFLFIVCIVVVFICLQCKKSEKIPKPDNLIEKERVVNILSDILIFRSAKNVNKKLLETKGVNVEGVILKKYGIDSLQFAQTLQYLASDFDSYHTLLKQVEGKLDAQLKILDSVQVKK